MFARLLESRNNQKRSVWGALFSTIAHTAVIAVAVFATAQARVDDPAAPEVVVWIEPPIAKPPTSSGLVEPSRPADQRKPTPPPAPFGIDRIDVVIPPVDLTPSLPLPGPAAVSGASDSAHAKPMSGTSSTEPFMGDQVERQVYLRPGSSPPRYPSSLRAAGIEGQVVALFVVSEGGRVEHQTVRFTVSDNPLFEEAVRNALAGMRFVPAEVGGRKVRQLVQMPFVFTLTR